MAEPKLRFRNEDGTAYPALKNSTMGDYYTERNERGGEGLPVLSVSIHSGVSDGELDEEELGKRVNRSADLSLYKKALSGDLVFNMMRAWQGAVGSVRTSGMVSPAYIVAEPNDEIDPLFMDYYVQTKTIIGRFNRLSYGALDFRKRLYWDSFITTEVNIPDVEEQRKIADQFERMDKVITVCEQETEKFKKLKKGLLQKMFPKKGEVVPEIRFPEYTGDWESHTLSELAELYQPSTISKSELIDKGKYPVCGANGLIGRYDNYNHENDEVCVTCRGATCGTVNYINGPAWITGNAMVCHNYEADCSKLFLFYVLQTVRWDTYITGGAQPQLTRDKMTNIHVVVPSDYSEQKRIEAFLGELDNLINLHQRECDKMKELKRGLLQQMFV